MNKTNLTSSDVSNPVEKRSSQQFRMFPAGSRTNRPSLRTLLIGFGFIVLCLIGVFTSQSLAAVGFWCIGLMLVLMFLSVPVAISLAVPSLIGIYGISGVPATINVLSVAPYNAVSSWSMSVLPMFIFMGMLLTQSGLTSRMFRATDLWFGWMPGGLGVGTNAAGAALASVSGSTIGMTYALGRASIPEMLRAGYDKRMAVGTVIVSGLGGQLIPPSILLVVYASIASVAVGPQLMAGVLPGILVAVTFGLFILLIGIFNPKMVGREKTPGSDQSAAVSWGDRLKSLGDIWSFPILAVILFGGMFSGLFTPTEAGAAAALVALLITLFYKRRQKPLTQIAQAAVSTVSATAAIFFILIGAEMLTRLMSITGIARIMTDFILGLGLSQVTFLFVLILLYLIMGMFFDTLSMMLLTIPILLPALEQMGISALWFGVFVVFLGEIAQVTPPVGILSYILHSIVKNPDVNLGHDITLKDIFVSVGWFLPVALLFLVLLIFWPQMVEIIPSLM